MDALVVAASAVPRCFAGSARAARAGTLSLGVWGALHTKGCKHGCACTLHEALEARRRAGGRICGCLLCSVFRFCMHLVACLLSGVFRFCMHFLARLPCMHELIVIRSLRRRRSLRTGPGCTGVWRSFRWWMTSCRSMGRQLHGILFLHLCQQLCIRHLSNSIARIIVVTILIRHFIDKRMTRPSQTFRDVMLRGSRWRIRCFHWTWLNLCNGNLLFLLFLLFSNSIRVC
mmetsp:Transcript_115690/g.212683  ORF Transcript_115690/g.212683 Transcript_115690/m.212683 type:complete len:230 (+) Transcript_115690:145-834(+)